MLPRDAFFGPVEQVPVAQAVGRVTAEMVSLHPLGVPVLAPGVVTNAETVEYLTTGVAAGMLIPDAADPRLTSLRVVRRDTEAGWRQDEGTTAPRRPPVDAPLLAASCAQVAG